MSRARKLIAGDEQHPCFHVQETLFSTDSEPTLGLTCPRCNFIIDARISFLRVRAGDRMGCPSCRRICTIPMVEV